VAADLLEQIMLASPQFFERLVVTLLVAMGYGGSYAEAAKVTRATGDGGIDGLINEDRLGLDVIYYRPSGGRLRSADPKSRNSLVALTVSERARVCSSRHRDSAPMLGST
jgi:Restriction endonuclease